LCSFCTARRQLVVQVARGRFLARFFLENSKLAASRKVPRPREKGQIDRLIPRNVKFPVAQIPSRYYAATTKARTTERRSYAPSVTANVASVDRDEVGRQSFDLDSRDNIPAQSSRTILKAARRKRQIFRVSALRPDEPFQWVGCKIAPQLPRACMLLVRSLVSSPGIDAARTNITFPIRRVATSGTWMPLGDSCR